MPAKSKKNYKGRSLNVLRYIESCGSDEDIGSLIPSNLAAGARLAAQNESQAHDEKTSRTYELRLMALEQFAEKEGDDAVLFGPNKRPFLAATIQTFMQVLRERKGKRLGTLRCRGLKPPAVRGHAAAFTYWFNVFGHTGPDSQSVEVSTDGTQKVIPKGNPMSSAAVKQTIKQLVRRASRPTRRDTRQGRVAYEPKKAPPFTLQQLARMRQYCLRTIEGMRGLWLWVVTLFSFALFLRGEEPLRLKLRHLRLPQNYAADSGKMPQRIEVKIPWSKADKKAKGDLQYNNAGVTLSLWANPLKAVTKSGTGTWGLGRGTRVWDVGRVGWDSGTWDVGTWGRGDAGTWGREDSGTWGRGRIKKGQNYIFPRVAKNNREVLPYCARGVTTYRKTFLEMSKSLFNKEFTTHSIRRSAARWAARCGANDSSIKRAGRWKSNSFELYTQDARAEMIKEHHDGQPVLDHKMWLFKPLR
ncbi:hypothetical protein ACROYT_G032376 [Oculina patagonica]